jgi:1,2-diacylglycerol 3-beta-galactosyltransferase
VSVVDFVFFDAGGGHRSSAVALCEAIRRQNFPWQARMVNLQEVLDPIDIMRRTTGIRIEDQYNAILKRGWTLGARHLMKVLQAAIRLYHRQEVHLLQDHWNRTTPDLVVSIVPHFNRALHESLLARGTPFVTLMTDIADYPPHFWIESQEQYIICGSDKAVEQAREIGIPPSMIFRSSGMIVHPRFYDAVRIDRRAERQRLGLDPERPTGLVLFGGQGSPAMLEIATQIERSDLAVQFVYVCGKNQKIADQLRASPSRHPRLVEGFTTEVPYYMQLADFFIGKPGPGSISEALLMKLPVIVQRNAWTLPQERYNATWILENKVGMVVRNFREIDTVLAELLKPETFSVFRSNAAALANRAVFEIPVILDTILNASHANSGTGTNNQAGTFVPGGTSNVSASGTTLITQGS